MSKRVAEVSLIQPTLTLLVANGGFLTTSTLIKLLTEEFHPRGLDRAVLDHRNDTRFSQKVRNLISHRNSPSSFISQGFANYDSEAFGLRITRKGRAYVRRMQPALAAVA